MTATKRPGRPTVARMPRLKVPESYFPPRVREAVQAALNFRGKGTRQLCNEIGIDPRTLDNFVNEDTETMDLRTVVRVADRLKLTVSQLLGELPLEASPQALTDHEMSYEALEAAYLAQSDLLKEMMKRLAEEKSRTKREIP